MVTHAVRTLRGMRLCAAGNEERITHLIMSSEHRTLKVCLCVLPKTLCDCPRGVEAMGRAWCMRGIFITVEVATRMQVLLAVANGAWLLSPEWVTASLEAGQWLPEQPFEAQVRISNVCNTARSRRPSYQCLVWS